MGFSVLHLFDCVRFQLVGIVRRRMLVQGHLHQMHRFAKGLLAMDRCSLDHGSKHLG